MAKYRPEPHRPAASPRADHSARPTIRLDKWLWQARFFKSRPLACEMIAEGHLRLNGQRCLKPGHQVGLGDTLTFPQGSRIRLIRVLAPGNRRGPAVEARALYHDLDPPPPSDPAVSDLDDAEDMEQMPPGRAG